MSSGAPQRPTPQIGDGFQFLMELASLIGIGLIGWHLGDKGVIGAVLAVVLILLTGEIWRRFRTPGFVPTGEAPLNPVSGPIRIALEFAVYLLGIFGIWWSGREQTAWIVAGVMILTLVISYKRLIGLWFTRI